MRLEYIIADFDSAKDNKFNSTYDMLRALVTRESVSSITKQFVNPRSREYGRQ